MQFMMALLVTMAISVIACQGPAATAITQDEAESAADLATADTASEEFVFDEFDDPIWPVKRGIDPAADRILRDWSAYLAGADAFTVTLEVAEDVLRDHGQIVGEVFHRRAATPNSQGR